MNRQLLSEIQAELAAGSDEATLESERRFFKEEVLLHGVKMSVVNKTAAAYFKRIKHLDKQEIFALCEELLKTDYGEEAMIAFKWAYRLNKQYAPDDFTLFEGWLDKYVNTWAKCDEFCNHAVGEFIERYPEYVQYLKQWARSDNRWVRRGAAVTLILPARRGRFLGDVFEIAGILLLDEEDLVRKGYGWMLKEASRLHREEVFDYVVRNRAVMPRVALRYAIELMPQEMRRIAMSKESGE
jgi:3-methyladenine DNA glycosylase AlkD